MRNTYLRSHYIPGRIWLGEFQQYINITIQEMKTCVFSVRGLFQNEIAEKMNISVRTVAAHLANARDKIRVAKEEFIEIFFSYF